MKIFFILSLFFLFFVFSVYSQEMVIHALHVKKPLFFARTKPLREMKIIEPKADNAPDHESLGVIPNLSHENANTTIQIPDDRYIQRTMGSVKAGNLLVNVEGIGNLQNKLPPDTEGDIGSDFYLQMINMSLAVFDKSGNLVFGPVSNLTIWQNAPGPWAGNSNGDPIVLYDETAGRWLISELSFPNYPNGPYYEKIAVSETSDPTGSWFLYGYEYEYFCDYPKIGIWHDGYYMTSNNNYYINSQWDFHAVGVSVFERDSMLAGSPDARRIFFDFYPNTEPWSMLPADFDGNPPSEATPAFLAYYKEGSPDHIKIYKIHSDWEQPSASTMMLENTLFPESFSGNLPLGIPQPQGAPYLSPMSNRLLYRLQYRNFGQYQTMVTNHTINTGNNIAGIRWYEFRDNGTGWQIFQQGSWSPDDTCRWMGSVAMDGYGNIALGYSVSGTETYPSIRITGRLKNDPPGVMTVEEKSVVAGSGVQLNSNHRWGDYSSMSVDPLNHTTFWYTQQYYQITGNRCWQTRIAAFNLNEILNLNATAENDTICLGDSVRLLALSTGGEEPYDFLWTSDPPGFISSLQNPVFTPDTTTRFFCNLSDGVNMVADTIIIHVFNQPEVFAGYDTLIHAGESHQLTQAMAENYATVQWGTSGNGYFDDDTLVNAIYTPDTTDIGAGSVILSLTAFPRGVCDTISYSMILTITPFTGIKQNNTESPGFTVQTGLSDETMNIILEGFPEGRIKVSLWTSDAKLIRQEEFHAGVNKPKTIRFHSINPGIYFVEIKSLTKSFTRKVVVF